MGCLSATRNKTFFIFSPRAAPPSRKCRPLREGVRTSTRNPVLIFNPSRRSAARQKAARTIVSTESVVCIINKGINTLQRLVARRSLAVARTRLLFGARHSSSLPPEEASSPKVGPPSAHTKMSPPASPATLARVAASARFSRARSAVAKAARRATVSERRSSLSSSRRSSRGVPASPPASSSARARVISKYAPGGAFRHSVQS